MTPIDELNKVNAVDNSTQALGRNDAWTALDQYVKAPGSGLLYVWGAPGTGKTFLLHHFSGYWEAGGHAVVRTSFRDTATPDTSWWQTLVVQFALPKSVTVLQTIADVMVERCQSRPFLWVVDDCDSLAVDRNWVVQVALELTRHGGHAILTGRASPFQLWPQSDLHSRLQFFELTDWGPELTQQILRVRGITEPNVVQHAIRLTHGRPTLVSAIVAGMLWLKENQVPVSHQAFMADAMDLSGFLIEQICHPGSRQLTWHAGRPGDDMDTVIAAAAVVPVFNRDWMTHMVGRPTVAHTWERFVSLPLVNSYLGNYYGLFPEVRHEVMTTVRKIRPWMWEHWLRRAADYYLGQVGTGRLAKQNAWGSLYTIIRTDLGGPVFTQDPATPPLEAKWERIASESRTAGLVYLESPTQERLASPNYTVEDIHTLRVTHVTHDSQYRGALLQLVATLASTFYLYDAVTWENPQTDTERQLLQLLQFSPMSEDKWHLRLGNDHFMQWMASLIRPPTGRRPHDPVRLVHDALQGLRDGKEYYGAEANDFWASVSPDGTFRAWFLDALLSAELGERVEGKSLLVLYYLDRRGTHEELAEILHVSRATYFRNHRLALEKLAQAVFD